jgi:hypothetical protein
LVTEATPGEAVRIFRQGLLDEGDTLALAEVDAAGPTMAIDLETPDVDHPVRITYVAHAFPKSDEKTYLTTGDSLTIGVGFHASMAVENVVFALELQDDDGNSIMRTDTSILNLRFDLPVGPGLVNFFVEQIPLLDGAITYSIGVQSGGGVLYDWRERAGRCPVMNPGKTTGSIQLPVQAHLLPPEPDTIAVMAPEELVHLEQQA